jgi:uncharacterized protein (TIGR03084 family)
MATDLSGLVDDLRAESEVLVTILAGLDDADWTRPTPAAGWTVTDQVSHLAYFDETTLLSLTDEQRFRLEADALTAAGDDFPDKVAADHRHLGGADLLAWFRRSRAELLDAYAHVDPRRRLPWYGPDMGPASSVTARLMETWAHGQDIADAVGAERPATDRLRHIAHLAVRTLGFSFVLNGRTVPSAPVRVELVPPSGGDVWAWGASDAPDRVTGTALDFCLVVTQRRHLSDTALQVTGATAQEWISIAQTFAGAPGTGRAPMTTQEMHE